MTPLQLFSEIAISVNELQEAMGDDWQAFADKIMAILNEIPPEPNKSDFVKAVDSIRRLRDQYPSFKNWYGSYVNRADEERMQHTGAKLRPEQETVGHIQNHINNCKTKLKQSKQEVEPSAQTESSAKNGEEASR